jgi:hypothetical protein
MIGRRAAGDFDPWIKFNGKSGRWYNKTDDGQEVEVQNLTAIFDLAQTKTGWLLFQEGQAPDALYDSENGVFVAQPSPSHKRGVSVRVYSQQQLGGVRELSANSDVVCNAMQALYNDQFEPAPEAGEGLVPVVRCESVIPVKSKHGTNYQPVLKITKWVPRPDALPLAKANGRAVAPVATPVVATAAAHPATANHGVPPPAVRAAASDADSEEF